MTQPKIYYDESNTLNVEWLDKDLRFGISYDHDEKKWFWWYASPTAYDHGWLPDELIQAIISKSRDDIPPSPYWSPGLYSH